MKNFENFFTKLYSDKHKTVSKTDKEFYMKEADKINEASAPSATLNCEILESEVNECIASLKLGKASSSDMINNEILKGLDNDNVSLLSPDKAL